MSDQHIPRARRRHTSHSYSHKSHRRASSTASESEASPPRRKRHRHRDSSLSSSSTSSSASSTSGSSSSSRRRRRYRRRHHTRHRRCHSSSTAAIASISCSPPLPGHLQHHIKLGKYVNFDKLLLPLHTPPLFTGNQNPSKQRKTQKRQITDLNSWLEAWNRYATCRIASDPRIALELIKYQTVISLLFARYPAMSVIEYVWALTQPSLSVSNVHGGQSFRDRAPITAHLGPPVKHNPLTSNRAPRMPSGKEICKRLNLGKCTRGKDCVFAHNCWYSNCQGDHPDKECPKRSCAPASSYTTTILSVREGISTQPGQCFHLEASHGTPARSAWTLVTKARLARLRQRTCHLLYNTHLSIDAELAKECTAGRILGPFQSRPLRNLRCSGVGVVPKKNNKWRMIMHLSAPADNSINDHISRPGMGRQPSLTPKQLMLIIWSCLLMHLAPTDVGVSLARQIVKATTYRVTAEDAISHCSATQLHRNLKTFTWKGK